MIKDAMKTGKTSTVQRQVDYFLTTIALAKKNNVFDALAAYGILPNNSRKVSREALQAALLSYFRVTGLDIKCTKASNGDSLLTEVRLCMNLNYQIVSCKRNNIQCAAQILYPEYS